MAGRSRFVAGQSWFVAGRKNNKSGAKCGARADRRSGPQTKVNGMSQEYISEKKVVARHFKHKLLLPQCDFVC